MISGNRLCLVEKHETGKSPFRLVSTAGGEVQETNAYLDSLATRGLSEKTMRIYGYDLLNFYKWLAGAGIELKDITRNTMLEYIRHQRETSSPAPATINHRLLVVSCLYQHHFDKHIPVNMDSRGESAAYFSPRAEHRRIGWMNSIRNRRLSVRVKMPRKIIVPLTRQEVSEYFQSLKTWRDISITGFMLFCGLRSKEVIGLQLYDVNTSEGQFRVLGKGNKERLVPMPANLLETVRKYLRLERPETDSTYLFVVLKGPKRGRPLTSGGLYKIFRIHRRVSGIYKANPHRFRHTFGADMARAGVSLPALMRLMGHAYVQTTMKYVNLFAEDIRDEFNRAMGKLRSREVMDETKTEF